MGGSQAEVIKFSTDVRALGRHLRLRRCARALEPYKTIAEFGALALGLVFGGILLVRTWAYPNASLALEVGERTARSDHDELIVDGVFTVGDAANLDISNIDVRCRHLDQDAPCSGGCGDLQEQLMNGRLPRGDSRGWACRYSVPTQTCVEITLEIRAKAAAIAWRSSRWRASTISCSAK